MTEHGRRFEGQVAVVTGGGGNIGAACARRLSAEGASVAIVDIDGESVSHGVAALIADGREAMGVTADLRQRDAVRAAMESVAERLGIPTVLVNSVGVFGLVDPVDLTDDEWDRVLDANLRSPFLCCQDLVGRWLERSASGAIVNVASIESIAPFPRQIHYAASKGGVAMLTKALALDVAAAGIRVNAVGPGTIPRPGSEIEAAAALGHQYPLGRLGTPDDVAAAVAFLASDDAAWITGQILYVEGGRLIR